jgi:aubergine
MGLMVVGYDVGKNSANRASSFGATVSCFNPSAGGGNYFTSVAEIKNGADTYNMLGLSIMSALEAYMELHQYAPNRILIYRDGVGDGDVSFFLLSIYCGI